MLQRECDSIDRNLIALLQEDARLSTSELSRRLGMARSTVTERLARLERDGIIAGYTAVVVADDNVPDTRSLLLITCDRSLRRQVVQSLQRFPEIRECLAISGPFDLACKVLTPLAEDVDALIDDLAAIPGVQRIEATMVLATKFARSGDAVRDAKRHLSLAS